MENVFAENGFPQVFLSGSTAEGFITIKNEEFYIRLTVSKSSRPKKVRLQGSWKLQQILRPVVATLEQHLAACSTFVDMLREIKSAVEQNMQLTELNPLSSLPPATFYETVLKQLQELGWNKVHSLNSELDTVELKAVDDACRIHYIKINLSENFPNDPPTYFCNLPEEFVFKWLPNKTLLDVFISFQSTLAKYSDFWTWMDEIDEYTWVLEPEKPTRSDYKRRIALAATASLLITVNPLYPSSAPVCSFMGPDSIIAPLRTKFNENIDEWDENCTLLTNLSNVLEMEFPSPLNTTKEEFCVECGICYSFKLGDSHPDVMCNEEKCKQPYHRICLYEWLKSLPGARLNFDTIFGDCPYCNMPIWCKTKET